MNYQEAYTHVIAGKNGSQAAGEMSNEALDFVVKNGKHQANVEAAQVVLAQRLLKNQQPKPIPAANAYLADAQPAEDDGFGPVGVSAKAPAAPMQVMPKAVVPQKQATAPWDAEEWGGFDESGAQDTALAVSNHQEVAPSIHPVGIDNLPDFDNMQQDIPLNMKKFEFTTAGQELRGLYIGIQKMQKNNKPFDSAVFQRKDGLIWASGIDLTSKLAPIPTGTPVLVRFQGTKNLANGNRLSTFDVFSLK